MATQICHGSRKSYCCAFTKLAGEPLFELGNHVSIYMLFIPIRISFTNHNPIGMHSHNSDLSGASRRVDSAGHNLIEGALGGFFVRVSERMQ